MVTSRTIQGENIVISLSGDRVSMRTLSQFIAVKKFLPDSRLVFLDGCGVIVPVFPRKVLLTIIGNKGSWSIQKQGSQGDLGNQRNLGGLLHTPRLIRLVTVLTVSPCLPSPCRSC